jgi:uncharacterized membrane protein YhaH (DUF805 family)
MAGAWLPNGLAFRRGCRSAAFDGRRHGNVMGYLTCAKCGTPGSGGACPRCGTNSWVQPSVTFATTDTAVAQQTAPALPSAGWYPDPTVPGGSRYWDGNAWGPAAPVAGGPQDLPAAPASFGRWAGHAKPVGPVDSARLAASRWTDYQGRSGMAEFWWTTLAVIVAAVLVSLVGQVLDPHAGSIYDPNAGSLGATVASLLALTFVVASVGIGLPLSVRRLHDTGRSGALVLVSLIPLVGSILLLVWTATGGDYNANQYGPAPR